MFWQKKRRYLNFDVFHCYINSTNTMSNKQFGLEFIYSKITALAYINLIITYF